MNYGKCLVCFDGSCYSADMNMLGGAFGAELARVENFPYREGETCAYVNSGRAALECILLSLPRRPVRAFVPRFTCDTVLQPFARLGIPVLRYEIQGNLFAEARPILPESVYENDLLLLTNYFGMSDPQHLRALAEQHPGICVVDAATALFAPPVADVPCFYSLRKFAGVPDGGVAVAPFPLKLPEQEDRSAYAAVALWQRIEVGAVASLPEFDALEARLNTAPRRMSPLTRALLGSIDWERIACRRCENYPALHARLAPVNRFSLPPVPPSAPFCYPLLSGIPGLRDELVDAHIALPLFWPEVIRDTQAESPANYLSRALLPLPIDQRYTAEEICARMGKL